MFTENKKSSSETETFCWRASSEETERKTAKNHCDKINSMEMQKLRSLKEIHG
jgi:hypothetical protein